VVNGARTHEPTPGQTIGPFFGIALPDPDLTDLITPDHPDAVLLTGLLLDGDAEPVPDGLVEVWQSTPNGGVRWGRCATEVSGRYRFRVHKDTEFVTLCVFARGLTDKLITRAYLSFAPDDPLWNSLPPVHRDTMRAIARGNERHFDIRLQGPGETVFLTPRDDH
jgi:protocatechuate 3,4-dioxygenase alpha subunit